jgi:GNAT superfamily N-acetyltransferase
MSRNQLLRARVAPGQVLATKRTITMNVRSDYPLSIDRVTHATRSEAVKLLSAQLAEHDIEVSHADLDRAVAVLIEGSSRGAVLMARDDHRCIGVAALSLMWSLEHAGRVAWLEELYVVPDRRGAGVGNALVERACELAHSLGCRAVDLEIDAGHAAAERLYARLGFAKLHRTRRVRKLAAVGERALDGGRPFPYG